MQKSLPFSSSPAPISVLPNFHFKTALKRPNPIPAKSILNSINSTTNPHQENDKNSSLIPTMPEIMAASRAQNLNLQLQTLGPFFRVNARSLETGQELGRAEGLVRVWFGGRILHLDSMRMRRETLSMEKSIFGLGLFVGAVAVRHGFDCGCKKAELLAINDTELYHSKVVDFNTLTCDFSFLQYNKHFGHGICGAKSREKRDNMQQQLITLSQSVGMQGLCLALEKGFYIAGKMAKKESTIEEDGFSSFVEPTVGSESMKPLCLGPP